MIDELTGEGLLVQQKTSNSDLKYYGLEYDVDGNWRAVFSKEFKPLVQKDKLTGGLVFSSKIMPKGAFVSIFFQIY